MSTFGLRATQLSCQDLLGSPLNIRTFMHLQPRQVPARGTGHTGAARLTRAAEPCRIYAMTNFVISSATIIPPAGGVRHNWEPRCSSHRPASA